MSLVAGARQDLGPEHEAAMDWAAGFAMRLDRQPQRAPIVAEWNGDQAKTYREQLKKTGQDALRQLVAHVRWRLDDLERAAALEAEAIT